MLIVALVCCVSVQLWDALVTIVLLHRLGTMIVMKGLQCTPFFGKQKVIVLHIYLKLIRACLNPGLHKENVENWELKSP